VAHPPVSAVVLFARQRRLDWFRDERSTPKSRGEVIMPAAEAWRRVAQECPRRIIGELHENGEYHHGTTARWPGKVLCCHRSSTLPADWAPTPAQEEAREEAHVAEPLPHS
jgi:hypothetical protein